jgi:hypothetical protein
LGFTTRNLGQPVCSSIAGIWVAFRLLPECTVLCFRFCSRLSKGFYNAPCFFTSGIPLLASSSFKAVAETTVWSRGGMAESETSFRNRSLQSPFGLAGFSLALPRLEGLHQQKKW